MDIQLKIRDENDSKFLFQLFSEIKTAELNANAWPESMRNQLILMQYNGYEQMIKSEYPNAEDYVIIADNKKTGRLQLEVDDSSIRIINISLLPAFHGNGIGTKIIKDVLAQADLKNKPVYLEVDKVNQAFTLYKRLGFNICGEDEIKYSMKYLPCKT
jgi:ribosomal protein S18 acetylase RimI-like enzyme